MLQPSLLAAIQCQLGRWLSYLQINRTPRNMAVRICVCNDNPAHQTKHNQ